MLYNSRLDFYAPSHAFYFEGLSLLLCYLIKIILVFLQDAVKIQT